MEEKVKEAARIKADLPKGFNIEDELYYNPQKMAVYKAFIQGATYMADLIISKNK